MILIRRPSDDRLDRLASEMASAPPTYAKAMGTEGYREDNWSRTLAASTTWEQAKGALRAWRAHLGAGVRVRPLAPPEVERTVALAIKLGPAYVLASCRIVQTVDTEDEYGFTYATLPVHPEQGEESFVLRRGAEGVVIFDVAALSKPSGLLARLGGPMSRVVQRRITDRYLHLDGLG